MTLTVTVSLPRGDIVIDSNIRVDSLPNNGLPKVFKASLTVSATVNIRFRVVRHQCLNTSTEILILNDHIKHSQSKLLNKSEWNIYAVLLLIFAIH